MPEKVLDTWFTTPKLPTASREACLVHIYPTGPAMGRRYPLGNKSLLLGRGDENEIRIPDNSVSRRHARIEPSNDGYYVVDLQSTNGTFVNDTASDMPIRLGDGDYLRIGNCIYKFLTGGNIEAHYHEEIYRLTIIDGLTDVHNQRYLLEFLDRELARSIRHVRPLAILMFDVDRFKAVNDLHGHLCGDYVLRELAQRVKGEVRREDLLARYGGEEFVMVLVETQLAEAAEVAERVRTLAAALPYPFEGQSLNLTVSAGIASTEGGEAGLTARELIRRADEKLYLAKERGRDRVVC